MPYTLQFDQTPSALRITRLAINGTITEPEANEIMKLFSPGGSHFGLPMLVISDASTEVSAAARRIFTSRSIAGAPEIPTAVVTPSAVFRVTVNFISRVNGNQSTRMFATEPDAVRWLEVSCMTTPRATEPGR